MSTRTLEERLWAKIDKRGPDECWPWTACTAVGYGKISVKNRGPQLAHRIVYELMIGPIREGMVIDHSCHDESCVPPCQHRKCCNPAHLNPITNAANVLRGNSMNARNARKTHCKRDHEFTTDNTIIRKDTGARQCRTCHNANKLRYYNSKKG